MPSNTLWVVSMTYKIMLINLSFQQKKPSTCLSCIRTNETNFPLFDSPANYQLAAERIYCYFNNMNFHHITFGTLEKYRENPEDTLNEILIGVAHIFIQELNR